MHYLILYRFALDQHFCRDSHQPEPIGEYPVGLRPLVSGLSHFAFIR